MPGPLPSDPNTRRRGNKTTVAAVIQNEADYIPRPAPPMPKFSEWFPGVDQGDWSPPVQQWWHNAWSSPMSEEFLDADMQQLHLACWYLQITLFPGVKVAERISAAAKHEACVKNFGLTPMARRTLQWQVSQVKQAKQREDRPARPGTRNPAADASTAPLDPRKAVDNDGPNPYLEAVPDAGATRSARRAFR